MGIRSVIIIPFVFLIPQPTLPQPDHTELASAEKLLERGRILYEESDYDSLPYYFLTARGIFQQHNNPVQTAACFLGMADFYRMNFRYGESASTLDSADIYIKEYIGTASESWADALITRGKLLAVQSQYAPAIDLIQKSLDLLEKLEADPRKIANTENLLGASYYRMGDLPKARDHYIKAYDRYQQMDTGSSAQLGWLLYNIALLHHRLGNGQDFREYLSRYKAYIMETYGPDHPDMSNYYSSLASYFIDFGMSDSARLSLEKSEEILMNDLEANHRGLVTLYIQHARIYTLEGDYHRALEYSRRALEKLQQKGDTRGFHGRSLFLNMGILYNSLGEYESAKETLLHLLDVKDLVHPTTMATYYYHIADNEIMLGDYDESEKYFRKVFEIRDQYLPQDYYSRATDQLGYGILLDSLGMSGMADEYFQKALRIIEQNFGFFHLRTARMLKSTGDHYQLAGEHEKALEHYQRSIQSMVPEYEINMYSQNPAPRRIHDNLFYLRLLKRKASVLMALAGKAKDREEMQQRMTGVYSAYQTSIRLIDQLRASYLRDESKLYLSYNERDTYEKFIKTAYHCYALTLNREYLEEAFIAAEKAKYATLLSVIQREESIALAGIPDSIVQMDAELRRDLSMHQELLLESQGDTIYDTLGIQYLQAQIFELSARIESLNHRLEREYPGYYDLLYNQRVLNPDDLRMKLKPSEKMLEYFFAGDVLFMFELSRQGMDCHRIPVDREFDQELSEIEQYLSRRFQRDSFSISDEDFLKAAHSLHEKLIPVSPDHPRLVIIPEGRLSYFPFDILVTERVDEFSGFFNRVPFLIREFSIRYGYSATLMDKMERRDRIRLDKLIAFAPGYGDTNLVASAGRLRELIIDRSSLLSLPGSIDEVNEISILSGGKAFTGMKATEGVFKELAGVSHIIHLATHAFLDDEEPLRSKLVFSEAEDEEDGFLNVYEIYNMDLMARMVVLSACNTGTGKMKSGEGIMSLARAFIYAGVPNIVMTLWTVSDIQSYKLMLGFYRKLIAGNSTEDALRRAKLEFLDQADPRYQHPRYWAGYILVGSPDKFFISRLYKLIISILLVMIILATGIIIIRKRAVKRRV